MNKKPRTWAISALILFSGIAMPSTPAPAASACRMVFAQKAAHLAMAATLRPFFRDVEFGDAQSLSEIWKARNFWDRLLTLPDRLYQSADLYTGKISRRITGNDYRMEKIHLTKAGLILLMAVTPVTVDAWERYDTLNWVNRDFRFFGVRKLLESDRISLEEALIKAEFIKTAWQELTEPENQTPEFLWAFISSFGVIPADIKDNQSLPRPLQKEIIQINLRMFSDFIAIPRVQGVDANKRLIFDENLAKDHRTRELFERIQDQEFTRFLTEIYPDPLELWLLRYYLQADSWVRAVEELEAIRGRPHIKLGDELRERMIDDLKSRIGRAR